MIEFDQAQVSGRLDATTLSLSEQRIGIIGFNGSGKSTLARLINGLVEPDDGHVRVMDLDTVKNGRQVRRRTGFVFTDPNAQLVMPTVIEDVSLSLRHQYRDKTARREAALAALARFDLVDLAERSVHQLSGGQRQLVAMTSVLATAPDIVVADEPTTLLDLRNARLMGNLLFSIEQQLVLVTHDLDLASRCERVLVIDSGSVVHDGSAADAIAHYLALA